MKRTTPRRRSNRRHGVAQFFTKNSLQQRFLDDRLVIRSSIEITCAYHAPGILTATTGRSLARRQGAKTQRFHRELLAERRELGIGYFAILKENIGGIVSILVVPGDCHCGAALTHETDIVDALKSRSAIVRYQCAGCGSESEFSFCLPHLHGLSQKRMVVDGGSE